MYSAVNRTAFKMLYSLYKYPNQRRSHLYFSESDRVVFNELVNDGMIVCVKDPNIKWETCVLSNEGKKFVETVVDDLKKKSQYAFLDVEAEVEKFHGKIERKMACARETNRKRYAKQKECTAYYYPSMRGKDE